ncbi:uncharacterized protein LOC119661953 [Teleopsis dalmanni]|uniref:uncharacterized protein LOC119661953 n=1 Tax=Teleopsis dalmanni TaxID=139649 RepID=UPI0018CE799A|nr:uncharacterized protein LOC119661953 [Teleopsis dalmanni]
MSAQKNETLAAPTTDQSAQSELYHMGELVQDEQKILVSSQMSVTPIDLEVPVTTSDQAVGQEIASSQQGMDTADSCLDQQHVAEEELNEHDEIDDPDRALDELLSLIRAAQEEFDRQNGINTTITLDQPHVAQEELNEQHGVDTAPVSISSEVSSATVDKDHNVMKRGLFNGDEPTAPYEKRFKQGDSP